MENTFQKIYAVVKTIPQGYVATYGDIAFAVGNPRLARVVGYALHANPDPATIKCHRVVNRQGRVSDAFVFGGKNRQIALLRAEGVAVSDDGYVDLSRYRWPCLPTEK